MEGRSEINNWLYTSQQKKLFEKGWRWYKHNALRLSNFVQLTQKDPWFLCFVFVHMKIKWLKLWISVHLDYLYLLQCLFMKSNTSIFNDGK